MNIGLLSVSMNVYSTKRIAEEAENLGHYIEQIDHTKCVVKLGKGKPQIFYHGENITNEFDAVIPRIGSKVTRHGAAIVKQFEMNGIFSTARSLSITRARNKVRTLQIMSRKGIPIPETLFAINPDNIKEQIEILGGAPVIIKLQEGTQGLGVILAETKKSAKSIIDTLYKPTRKERFIALNATKHLGLGVAGVDLIRSKKGPLLIEVNASPGLQGIEAATGVNIAKEIILFVERNGRRRRK